MLRTCCCLFLLLALNTGCQEEPTTNVAPFYPPLDAAFQSDMAEEAEIFNRLQNLQIEPLRRAFAALHSDTFTATVHLMQSEASGALVEETRQQLAVFGADSLQVLSQTTQPAFKFGVLSPFVSDAVPAAPRLVADHVLPDDPPYLTPRMREAYRYHQLADTLLKGTTYHVYEVAARPEIGDNQSIRRARFYVEPTENVLTGFYLQRRDKALFYHETSQHLVRIKATSTGWAADSLRLQARIKAPFRPAEVYEMAVSYEVSPS